jgi:hypothetical protein
MVILVPDVAIFKIGSPVRGSVPPVSASRVITKNTKNWLEPNRNIR